MTRTIMVSNWPPRPSEEYVMIQNGKGKDERVKIVSVLPIRRYSNPGMLIEYHNGRREFLKIELI